MTTNEYRKWIEAGYKDYGKDPWFFLRELAQNSRDAGARTIRVTAGRTSAGEEIIVFEDDGEGMSYDHALKYLFRLYASSKTNRKNAAGMFGIGFWTVFKFSPSRLLIQSNDGNEPWGVEVDKELTTRRITGELAGRGTRITLVRPAQASTVKAFAGEVEKELKRYCSYLRTGTRESRQLPVLFQGQDITRPMGLPGPVSLTFKKGAVEGVVGLGARPRVDLYARGLPVWQGTTLDELSHTPPSRGDRSGREMARGLAPVFLLNGNNLEVNISRRRVIDNRALDKMRKNAENALYKLIDMVADSVSRRGIFSRWVRKLKRKSSSVLGSFWKTLAVCIILVLPLEYLLLTHFFKGSGGTPGSGPLSMRIEDNRYSGASVGGVSSNRFADISYTPPVTTWFKLYHAGRYQPDTGFVQSFGRTPALDFPPIECGQGTIDVQLRAKQRGVILLPQPVGHFIDPGSVTIDGKELLRTVHHGSGSVLASVAGEAVIRYRTCPLSPGSSLSPEERRNLLEFPSGTAIPSAVRRALDSVRAENARAKAAAAIGLTVQLLQYDDSIETAREYENITAGGWFRRVLTIGRGDCDILNGATILFLRYLGVPARLVIGLTGEKGKLFPGMHAWTEYFDAETGWRRIDATMYAVQRRTGRSGSRETAPAAPIPSGFDQPRPISPTPSASSTAAPSAAVPAQPPMETAGTDTGEAVSSQPSKDTGEIGSAATTGEGGRAQVWIIAALLAVLLVLLFSLLVALSRRQRPNPFHAVDRERMKEKLAGMVLHALVHPDAWGGETELRDVAILPTVSGRFISVRRALRAAKGGKLFFISRDNPLAEYLRGVRTPVLEMGHAAFDPLIKVLPDAIDLDRVEALRAEAPGTGEGTPLDRLLSETNNLLPVECRPAPGLTGTDTWDVDFSALPVLKRAGLPRMFIAVNPQSPEIRSLEAVYQKNPALARFRLIRLLLKGSALITGPKEKWLQKAAKKLLTDNK